MLPSYTTAPQPKPLLKLCLNYYKNLSSNWANMKPCPASIPQLVDKTIWLVARGGSQTVSSVDADVQDKPARFVACTKISQQRNTALCSISLVNGAKDVAGTQSLRIKHRTARTMLASEARGFHINLPIVKNHNQISAECQFPAF